MRTRYVLMKCSDIDVLPDYERIYVYGATVSSLVPVLDSAVPWVWILGHRPNRYSEWWQTTVPLNTNGTSFIGSVRNICLDIQMPTSDFIAQATDFDEHGLVLIQSRQQMPDTLCLERSRESDQRKVLVQNGATLRIYLPHAVETALVQSFNKGYLASVRGT